MDTTSRLSAPRVIGDIAEFLRRDAACGFQRAGEAAGTELTKCRCATARSCDLGIGPLMRTDRPLPHYARRQRRGAVGVLTIVLAVAASAVEAFSGTARCRRASASA